jgi:uncharacterized protein YcbK (DUF882 family)
LADATAKHLALLQPFVRVRAIQLINSARGARVPLIITSSRRTAAQQRALYRAGRSNTLNSLHELGRAFDVDVAGLSRSRVSRRFWEWLGGVGEDIGFRWGGRWLNPYDPGHFEL